MSNMDFSDCTDDAGSSKKIFLSKTKLSELLVKIAAITDFRAFKKEVATIKSKLDHPKDLTAPSAEREFILPRQTKDSILVSKEVFREELEQILASNTIERAKHYLERLLKGITEVKTKEYSDINLNRWKEYDHILTDSLWLFDKRDSSGVHEADYWGNFIPQIPHQMILRYTKKDDWVLDGFLGLGTTLIECKRLGRNGLGVELNPSVAKKSEERIAAEKNPFDVSTDILVADSRTADLSGYLAKRNLSHVQLVILHPPYYDIIKFSEDDPNDLSNAASTADFISMFGEVIANVDRVLEPDRYLIVVIGDKYSGGEWIPLGFLTMSEVLKRGYTLVSVIVKNFRETKGKRQQHSLWRYRALNGGFYVFKHEYILVFKKEKNSATRVTNELLSKLW